MLMLPLVLSFVSMGILVASLFQLRKKKRREREQYLSSYPSPDMLLVVVDRCKYREIRDSNGRTGVVRAVRALKEDFPGITIDEAAYVVDCLGN